LIQHVGHSPSEEKYQCPDFEYRGRDAIAVIADGSVSRVRLTRASQAFFAMFQNERLKPTPYGQIDASHLFEDLPFDTLQVSVASLSYCYGKNIFRLRQIEVSKLS
jgi:hypothetical protein